MKSNIYLWWPPGRSRHVALESAQSTRPARPRARFGVPNRRRDLVEITASELDCRGSNPAVHLLWRAGADNGSAHSGPRKGPGNGNARHRGFVPLRDGLERVPQGEIPAEKRLLELRRTAPPIVLSQRRHALRHEILRQQPGLHGAVADDPRVMARTPGNLLLRRRTIDQRKRRLQRIHVPDRLATVEQYRVEVRYAYRADLSFLDELRNCGPGFLDGRTRVRPVELIQIDALAPEPAERRFAFAANRLGAEVAPRRLHAIALVPDEAALRENERALGARQLAKQLSHDFLGMPEPVDRRGIDPVDPQRERMAHRGQRRRIVLRSEEY